MCDAIAGFLDYSSNLVEKEGTFLEIYSIITNTVYVAISQGGV